MEDRKLISLAKLFEGIAFTLSFISALIWMSIVLLWASVSFDSENADIFGDLLFALMPLATILMGQVLPFFCITLISKKEGVKTKKMRFLCCVLGLVKLSATAVVSLGIAFYALLAFFALLGVFGLLGILWVALYALCSISSLVLALVDIFLAK